MPYYCVNKNAQSSSGDHEVHDLTPGKCHNLPEPQNRESLGFHATCKGAVQAAKRIYAKSDGCKFCCPECHTS